MQNQSLVGFKRLVRGICNLNKCHTVCPIDPSFARARVWLDSDWRGDQWMLRLLWRKLPPPPPFFLSCNRSRSNVVHGHSGITSPPQKRNSHLLAFLSLNVGQSRTGTKHLSSILGGHDLCSVLLLHFLSGAQRNLIQYNHERKPPNANASLCETLLAMWSER